MAPGAPAPREPDRGRAGGRSVCSAAPACVLAYALLPLAFLQGPLEADAFSILTLKDVEGRPGRAAAFDRAVFLPEEGAQLRLFSGEILRVEGIALDAAGR